MKTQISLFVAAFLRRILCALALLLVIHTIAGPYAIAFQKTQKDAKREAKFKAKAETLGPGAEVTILMRDGTKRNGLIKEISDQGLLLDSRGEIKSVPFAQVSSISRRKPIWAKGTFWAAIGVGIFVVVIAITKPMKG